MGEEYEEELFVTPRTKSALIYAVLKRWWYAMADWPPKDIDYDELVSQKGFRVVKEELFNVEPEKDSKGKAHISGIRFKRRFVGIL